MKNRVFAGVCSALLLSAVSAQAFPAESAADSAADNRYDPAHKARFRAADTDNSRGLSRAEVKASLPLVLLRHFDEIDTDSNGELSPDELVAMRKREDAQREARRQSRLDELRGGAR